MDRKAKAKTVEQPGSGIWAQIIASHSKEEEEEEEGKQWKHAILPVYQRRRPRPQPRPPSQSQSLFPSPGDNLTFAAPAPNNNKRVSWNRSLSTRGRTSIAIAPCAKNQPQQKQAKRKAKPPLLKGQVAELPKFDKEKEYFQEVDAFELLEESPSPKNFGTWVIRNQCVADPIPKLSSRLEKWLNSNKLNFSCGPSSTLSKILETPAASMEPLHFGDLDSSLTTLHECDEISASAPDEGLNDINYAIRRLSLTSTTKPADLDHDDPFPLLLEICEQSVPSKLLDLFSKYCDPENIVKIGEGTYGEAFKAGNTVCKIVPFDGDFPVNGEVQKKTEELLEEAVLSWTLNILREFDNDVSNACTNFIETIDLKVCQGPYDAALIRAWENWDQNNGSENGHPKEFPEEQRYVVFVLQHGGKDLESFVLENFDEARSLLVQVIAALAVAEAAYEFEHRDLHWGNVLLIRDDSVSTKFILEGKKMVLRTFGLSISIIDFTLSRINTGEKILFLDLSMDPYLFKGPKGDKQSETYRKMKEVTEDYWEGSFPRTNVLWLLYLVDILLLKKTFVRSPKNERDLRSLKKRLDKYNSAKEAIFDPFFGDLLVDDTEPCGCE